MFRQQFGVDLSHKTMGRRVEQAAELLKPVYRSIREDLLAGNNLQADETPIRYLDPDVKGKRQQGYLWASSRPKGDVLFEWQVSRSREGPETFLKPIRGNLQTNGYYAYESLAKERDGDLMLIACWAHTRRGYHEALAESKLAARFVGRLGTFTQWKKNCARKKSRAATTRRTARLAKPASIAAAAPGNGVDPANDVATRITGSGHRLRLETVECTKLIRGRRRSGNRRQSRRKFDSAQCSWKAQLVVHWAS